MTPERWREVKRLLAEALERPESERSAFLEVACRNDPSLRPEIESLLLSEEEMSLLERPQKPPEMDPQEEDEPSLAPQSRIGPYQVAGELGRGGMGAVYLAVRADEQFHKRVAIKVVRRGMDSQLVLRRFRQERQILAGLDHPNIARLLDGGNTDDGLPYLVMEYVEGQAMTGYCDRRTLGIEKRLELFRTVCSAVQFAHQNLVVHRDLKPSNVFVTLDGVPKLLDFGIAKLLNSDVHSDGGEATATAARVLTPDYASPEQVRGERITTASDVYSLGVLLYELLTGHRPYRIRTRTPDEIARVVCEQEPENPSTAVTRVEEVPAREGRAAVTITPESVSRAREGAPAELKRVLAGDLDAIVLKAMRKEPKRRYASVEQFSEDIRRYLEGEPVGARKGTFAYRSSKFLRRHRLAMAAVTLVLITFLGGMATTLWQARIARLERARAERRFNDVRRLAKTFLFEIHDGIAELAGSTKVRALLVTRALEYLDSLAKEQGNDRSLQQELAEAYERVGNVQGEPGSGSLGDSRGARQSYAKALAIREGLVAAEPTNVRYRDALAQSYIASSYILATFGDSAGSFDHAKRALAICEPLAAANPGDLAIQERLGGAYHALATVVWSMGDGGNAAWRTPEGLNAFELYSKEARLFEEIAARDPGAIKRKRNVALAYRYVANVLQKEPARALEWNRKAAAIYEAVVTADPSNAQYQRDLSFAYSGIGLSLQNLHDYDGAVEGYGKSLALREELARKDPENATVGRSLASAHTTLCETLGLKGDTRSAIDHGLKALAILRVLAEKDPSNVLVRVQIAMTTWTIGAAHAKERRTAEARRWLSESLATYRAMKDANTLPSAQAAHIDKVAAALAALHARPEPPRRSVPAPKE